mgnify:CR=1 FL=1
MVAVGRGCPRAAIWGRFGSRHKSARGLLGQGGLRCAERWGCGTPPALVTADIRGVPPAVSSYTTQCIPTVPAACGTGQASGSLGGGWAVRLRRAVLSLQPMEPELVVEQPQAPRLQPELPNGMEKVQVREVEKKSKLNVEELNRIEDEDVLDKMVRPSL